MIRILTIVYMLLMMLSCSSHHLTRSTASSNEVESIIQTVTYNTGLAKAGPIDLVACIKHREKLQADYLLSDMRVVDFSSPFVIGLQEVYSKTGYNYYLKKAKELGFSIYPSSFNDVKDNGQVFITNLEVVDYNFQEFSKDMKRRGIQSLSVSDKSGNSILFINVHTYYSDSANFLPEHQLQFEEISSYIDKYKSDYDGVVALGDFNAGPNLDFIKSTYPVAETIWDNSLIKLMDKNGMKVSSQQDKNTWDNTNKLVSKEVGLVVAGNFVVTPSHTPGWEEKSSILDHIFTSEKFSLVDSKLVMNETVTLRKNVCPGRFQSVHKKQTSRGSRFLAGSLYLSDHFGVKSYLSFSR